MKNIKIVGIAALAAVFLVGCGEQSVSESSSSSVKSSTSSVESSSVESSSSSTVESNVDMGDGSTDDIAVIVTDNQDIIKSSSTTTPDPDTSSSEPTSDTHEPTTSEPTSSSSQPTSSSSNSGTTSSSKPTGETSKPTSSSSQPPSSKPSSTPVTSTWNPDAPGNTPGPYGGYYDANGALHCKRANMPYDSYGYPVESYYTEDGMHILTKAENDKAIEEERRIANGGGMGAYDAGLTEDQWKELWGW